MRNEVAFANWWATEMKGQACPPVPRQLSELSTTAQMAMRTTKPELYTALFAGSKDAPRLPADVSVRLNPVQLQQGDAGAYELLVMNSKLSNVSVLDRCRKTNAWLIRRCHLARTTKRQWLALLNGSR